MILCKCLKEKCFGNNKNRCHILTSNDFKTNGCPFYKSINREVEEIHKDILNYENPEAYWKYLRSIMDFPIFIRIKYEYERRYNSNEQNEGY